MPLRHDARRGALCMLGAAALFTVMSALAKTLSASIPFNEMMAFRCAFALPVTLLVARMLRGGSARGALLSTRRPGGHALRALAGVLGMGCGFYSLTLLPLADQIAVNYTQPLFVILLAIPWLGERPGLIRWLAVLLGFAGVLVVALGQGGFGWAFGTGAARPDAPALGYAVAALAGLFGAVATMLVRQLSATESSTTIVLWQSILMTLMIGVTVPFTWVTPTPRRTRRPRRRRPRRRRRPGPADRGLRERPGLLPRPLQLLRPRLGRPPRLARLRRRPGPDDARRLRPHRRGEPPRPPRPPLHDTPGDTPESRAVTEIPFRRDDSLAPGAVARIAPGIRRVLCDNPGPFTGRGTNTWIIGPATPGAEVAVLDPGPDHSPHRDALLRATAGQRVTAILVSHTHRDHSPGAAPLAAAVNEGAGAPTMAFSPHLTPPEDGGEGADHAFTPDRRLPDGVTLEAASWRLTALHTPGHCANHLCFALASDHAPTGTLFTADQAMSWSTSIVSPPDGDMADYMRSLDRLIALSPTLLLPGHGPQHDDPAPFLAALRTHRLEREESVLAALRAATHGGRPTTAAHLVSAVYGPALDPRLAPAAARSLLAHLIKLANEGRAAREGDAFVA